jgi:hypothetical protein
MSMSRQSSTRGDLATSSYLSESKVESFWNPTIFLQCAKTFHVNLQKDPPPFPPAILLPSGKN